jgi:FAD/FMN-containing dehydrogenase
MSGAASTSGWEALQDQIAGQVVLPVAPEYDSARKPAMARFWHVRPLAIVRCHATADVAAALACARRTGLHVAVRGGGHSFAGCSTTAGLVIDLTPMRGVSLAGARATVAAGTTLGELYDALDSHGRTVAAGCGATVGVAGLTLGGGIGILGRRHGLTSDQLRAAQVVLADGRVVWCDEHRDADLFWALRGAGGCRFGIVTSLVLQTVAVPTASSFDLHWPEEAAASVIDAWQHWAPDAPEEVAASLLVTAPAAPGRPMEVRVVGAAAGTASDARDVLDGLVVGVGRDPTSTAVAQRPYRQTKRHLAERDADSTAKPDPGHVYAKSEFFRAPLPTAAIAALVSHMASHRVAGQARELDFTPWGGAYNRVHAHATAFAHRAERFLLKHEVVTTPDNGSAIARVWVERSWALAHPAGTGRAYPNFPDPDLDEWDAAYHGDNLTRLRRVKEHYDPEGVFSFEHPPSASDER